MEGAKPPRLSALLAVAVLVAFVALTAFWALTAFVAVSALVARTANGTTVNCWRGPKTVNAFGEPFGRTPISIKAPA